MDRVSYTTREEFGFVFHISVQPGSYSIRVSGPNGYTHTFEGPCNESHLTRAGEPAEALTHKSSPQHAFAALEGGDDDNEDASSSAKEKTDDDEEDDEDEPSTNDSETGFRLGVGKGKGKGKSASLATLRLLKRKKDETTTQETSSISSNGKPIRLNFNVGEPDHSSDSDEEGCTYLGASDAPSPTPEDAPTPENAATENSARLTGTCGGKRMRSSSQCHSKKKRRQVRAALQHVQQNARYCLVDGIELLVEARRYYIERVNPSKTRGGRVGSPGYQIDCPRTVSIFLLPRGTSTGNFMRKLFQFPQEHFPTATAYSASVIL